MKNYKLNYLPKDILAGIIIAAVSIPISMGYAEVSGLPPVYGLYGSVLPILFFAMFTTSPQFIFGVDAAPAAIIGAAAAGLGLQAQSPEAMSFIPMTALFAGCWLLLFFLLKAGKVVDYISTPVMGGFISGIAVTIILMQIPKILGGGSGTGELPELIRAIIEAVHQINGASGAAWCLFSGGDRDRKEACAQISNGDRCHGSRRAVDLFRSYRSVWSASFIGGRAGAAEAYVSTISVSGSFAGSGQRTHGCCRDHGRNASFGE